MRTRGLLVVWLLVTLGLSAGCQSLPGQQTELYRDLGERQGISRIVDALIGRIGMDGRIIGEFKKTDVGRFREHLIEQLCRVSGGPCEYTGDAMRKVHEGMKVTATQFNAIVEDLILAMEDADIPTGAQNRLLVRLAPMRDQIVTPPSR